jgi:hypothetical protein
LFWPMLRFVDRKAATKPGTKSPRQTTGKSRTVEVELIPHDNNDSDGRPMLKHEQAARIVEVDFDRMDDSWYRLLEGEIEGGFGGQWSSRFGLALAGGSYRVTARNESREGV